MLLHFITSTITPGRMLPIDLSLLSFVSEQKKKLDKKWRWQQFRDCVSFCSLHTFLPPNQNRNTAATYILYECCFGRLGKFLVVSAKVGNNRSLVILWHPAQLDEVLQSDLAQDLQSLSFYIFPSDIRLWTSMSKTFMSIGDASRGNLCGGRESRMVRQCHIQKCTALYMFRAQR